MYRKFAWYRYLFKRWNQLSRLQRSTIYLVLSVILVYIVYLYNQNLPPTGRPKVKASVASGREKWPPKFGDQERLPDMNGAVTDKANINGGADNEEHNAAVEEEQQDKQQAGQNDVDFDGGDSNNAVENRVEDGAAEKKISGEESQVGVVIADDSLVANKDKLNEKKAEMAIPPADGSLVFNGPQVCLINKSSLMMINLISSSIQLPVILIFS